MKDSIDYGVCRLSVVSMRKDPSYRSEQVSQLLFGDHYDVLEQSKDKEWLQIMTYYDQCEGWIHSLQHHSITREYFDHINRADFKITTDLTSSILYNKSPLQILMGSIIPISASELFKMEEQFAFNGEAKTLGTKRDSEALIQTASKYLHAPHQPGGKHPFGIDAAALIQMAFKINGYRLGRTLAEQQKQGREVKSAADAVPGDIAFLRSMDQAILHAGIILEGDKILHVAGKVRVDYFNEEGILYLDKKIYTHTLQVIRRILTD
jgi:gamma-D-glutamyl-L-lysine dipeptidyl-peptidase